MGLPLLGALVAKSIIGPLFNIPLAIEGAERVGSWAMFGAYLGFVILYVAGLSGCMIWLFNNRWRVSE